MIIPLHGSRRYSKVGYDYEQGGGLRGGGVLNARNTRILKNYGNYGFKTNNYLLV